MPKPMYVWSGSAWVSVASEVESLAGFATQSYADNTPGLRMVVPTSVAVGSGSGSVDTNGAVTFSGASTVSFNNCFSSTYDNYVVFLNMQTSSTSDLQFRWRVSNADDTTAVYNYQVAGLTSSNTASNLTGATQTLNKFGSGFANTITAGQLNFYKPFASDRSFFTSAHVGVTSGALSATYTGGGQYTNSTSFTGFTLYASAGNITGTARVYGMKN